jgi:hypothetical protein
VLKNPARYVLQDVAEEALRILWRDHRGNMTVMRIG